MRDQPKSDRPMRASRYFIEGEDIGLEGGSLSDCRYIKGSIAFSEWMAGFEEAVTKDQLLIEDIKSGYEWKRFLIPSIFVHGIKRQ
jgi:hypothetical protein